jgi:hypothetical protein
MPKYDIAVMAIINELNGLNFPQLLSPASYYIIVREALRKIDRYKPQTSFAVFPTIELVQDYYIFNTNDQPASADPNKESQVLFDANGAELNTGPWINGNVEEYDLVPVNSAGQTETYTGTKGVCSTALSIEDVYWNPGGDFTSLNIFSPGWQMLANVQLYSGSYFNQPSQMMIVSQKLTAWKQQFGSQGFELFGPTGDPGSFLRLYPSPLEDGDLVIVRFQDKNHLPTIGPGDNRFDNLMMWAKHYTAKALANYYAGTAGVQILGFTDSSKALQYWASEALRYEQEALIQMAGLHGEADRNN